MKLGKLSLVAVMALGTSAFAIDNVKVNGEAKVWYQTSETDGTTTASTNGLDFFEDGANSMAEVALTVGATADLLPNLSAGVSAVGLTTLGLEKNLVGMVPAARYDTTPANSADLDAGALNDQSWVRELYLAYTMGKTTVKIGRQELATPLAFTEKWNVVDNTFEAAVLLNNDIQDTTLVGAWVGKHNGSGAFANGTSTNTTVVQGGKFSTFGTDGAYAAGAINKSLPGTTVQGWYYNVCNIADAYWLQADAKLMDNMVELGVQYANMAPVASGAKDTSIYAVKAAVNVANSNFYAAYSSADKAVGSTVNFSNVATGDKSMIYTSLGSIYMDGEHTTKSDTDAWKIGASTKMVPGVALSASYGQASTDGNGVSGNKADYNAWDIVAAGNVGPLGLTAIYTQYEKEDSANTKLIDTDTLRIIASLKF